MQQNATVNYGLMIERNPNVAKAIIFFITQQTSKVMMKIMNNGEEVRLLLNEVLTAGKHSVLFDFNHLPKDVFEVRLIVETDTSIDIETQTITL
jgi:hypothetical protein